MYLYFLPTDKWKREAFHLLIHVVITLPLIYVTLSSNDLLYQPVIFLIYILILFIGIYRTVYYFRLPQKPYLIINHDSLYIDQGILFPAKQIPYQQIKRIVNRNEIIVLEQKNKEEEQIYTNFISEKDAQNLKEYLLNNVSSNVENEHI